MAKYNCSVCNAPSTSDKCFKHKARKGLSSRKGLRAKPKTKEEIEENRDNIEKQWEFFRSIWNTKPHVSEVSGVKLYGQINSMFFHHIMPKQTYEELKYEPENIILLHPDEHDKVEKDMYFYEEINKRRELLKNKFLNQ